MPPTQMLSGIEQVFGELIDLLGFISALVIRRELWDVVCREDRVSDFENFYVQVYIIGRALRRVPDWGVLNTPCVGYRTSNDQFLGKFGWLKRLQIDVTGYDQLGRGIFEDNEAARNAMRRRIFRAHILARVRNAKTSPGRTPDLIAASKLLLQVYGDLPEFWRSAVPILLMPKSIVVIARRLYQRYSANSGAYRARQLAARNT
jgi:hypothetical protein